MCIPEIFQHLSRGWQRGLQPLPPLYKWRPSYYINDCCYVMNILIFRYISIANLINNFINQKYIDEKDYTD
jgi:hypothetical protein